jgi:hypothetical protein
MTTDSITERPADLRGAYEPSPGPWSFVFDHPTSPTIGRISDADGCEVALFVRGQAQPPRADARLLAAAPDLLLALGSIVAHVSDINNGCARACADDDAFCALYEAALRAIAKAGGRR